MAPPIGGIGAGWLLGFGTPVVTVGAEELLGTEYNISGEE